MHVNSAPYASVALHKTTGATVIKVSGELDLGSVHHLEDCLSRAFADGDGKPIHVDMAEVSFVDCAGFAPVLETAAALQNGRVLKVISASRQVRKLVELIGDVGVPIGESSPDMVPSM